MNFIRNSLSVTGIPLWVSVYIIITVIIGALLGIPALLGSGLEEHFTIGWGGRELGIAVGALIAAVTRSAAGYVIVFVAGLFRELSDFLELLTFPDTTAAELGAVVLFFLIGLICTWKSVQGYRIQERSTT